MKGWKKIFHTNRDQKKAGVPILISDKIDFKIKAVMLKTLYLELEKIAITKFHQSILRYFRVGSDSDESPMCKFS